jgi:hypothetical protein
VLASLVEDTAAKRAQLRNNSLIHAIPKNIGCSKNSLQEMTFSSVNGTTFQKRVNFPEILSVFMERECS